MVPHARTQRTIVSDTARVFQLELQLVLSLCENIDSPRSLTVALLIKNSEWGQLLDLEVDHNHYDCSSIFMDDYLVTSILQKNPRLPTGIDKERVAIDKFEAAERQCAETNLRLRLYQDSQVLPCDLDIHRVIHYAREYIREILGPLSRADLSFAEGKMGFGPGATTSVSGVVTQGKKYSPRVLDVTPRLVDFGLFCLPPGWKKQVLGFRLRKSSKLTTVPKNAKTDRVICIEPDLNIFVQKGIGSLIREKLRRFGLDLNTQENNRDLARRAYTEDLCTIDLSAASDTVSREIVWLLLPERWAELLYIARVDETLVGSEVRPLEKWSSMGNGYTFELETLLFYALLLGVQKVTGSSGPVIAYGDDLITPVMDFELAQRALNFLGFNVNRDKTFGKGTFHESCGTDWYKGRNVRPFFLRVSHHDFPTVCYIYANGLRRWAFHRNSGKSCDRRLLPVWLRCFTAVEPRDRHQIPEGFGDVGFIENFDRSCPAAGRRHSSKGKGVSFAPNLLPHVAGPVGHPYGWGGFTFSYRHIGSREARVSEEGCLTASLNGVAYEWSLGREALRGRYRTAVTRTGYSLEWPNLGSWQ